LVINIIHLFKETANIVSKIFFTFAFPNDRQAVSTKVATGLSLPLRVKLAGAALLL